MTCITLALRVRSVIPRRRIPGIGRCRLLCRAAILLVVKVAAVRADGSSTTPRSLRGRQIARLAGQGHGRTVRHNRNCVQNAPSAGCTSSTCVSTLSPVELTCFSSHTVAGNFRCPREIRIMNPLFALSTTVITFEHLTRWCLPFATRLLGKRRALAIDK